ncbi:MAG: DUF4861 family protein [Flavobacteriaceae bacterium]
MIHHLKLSLLSSILILTVGCSEKTSPTPQFVVKNNLDINRSNETVEIDLKQLIQDSIPVVETSKTFVVIDATTKEEVISQISDSDGDGIDDVLLFQPTIEANSEKIFEVVLKEKVLDTDADPHCYSRFVPERTDDYAWENNRVAFRVFGPTAQKMIEDNVPGGTLSSGVDAWLKKVDYPIINKWYKEDQEEMGAYHIDTGEGLDNFHVGASRGVGGIAVKVDTSYYFSKNFTNWKTISTGPIRTSFVLDYADWDADGNTISETKHISLDYGSNLTRFEIVLKGADTIAVGLTLHEKDGTTSVNMEQGWASYWEPHEGSELGQGIVAKEGTIAGFEKYETSTKDLSNLYTHLNTNNGKIVYYSGFSWKESEQFTTKSEWNAYLSNFAKKLNNPLKINRL